jgi:hypothetical protein
MTIVAPAYLTQFGTTLIPGARGAFQWPTAARPSILPTIDGFFDAAGRGAAGIVLPYTLPYTGAAVHATDTTAILTELDALRARCDSYDRLWLHLANGTDRCAWARLVNVSPAMQASARGAITFALQFQVTSIWNGSTHSGSWTLDSGYLFDSGLFFDSTGPTTLTTSPQTITVTNGGNLAVSNPGLTISAGAGNITDLVVGIAGSCEFSFSGTITAGTSLVIDCGRRTVLNAGADAFDDFHRTANQVIAPWFSFAPGANSVVVSGSGYNTGSSIEFTFADGWA